MRYTLIFAPLFIVAVLGAGCSRTEQTPIMPQLIIKSSSSSTETIEMLQEITPDSIAPISRANERVTKKPFGLYVTPKNSPVTPEKFSGYHVGVDFEAFPEEADSDVEIVAICTGPLALKKQATGYGGVAVQRCTIDDESMTVIYGHLRLESITLVVGQEIDKEQRIGVLGKGYSSETDGERKHLHLGIHNGTQIDIRGYVQRSGDISQWRDIEKLLLRQ